MPTLVLPAVGLALALALPIAAGLFRLGASAVAPSPTAAGVALPGLGGALATSVGTATVATVAIAVGGVPLGFLLARGRGSLLALLGIAVQLPLALPPLVSGVLLLFALADLGALGRWSDTAAAIVAAQVFVAAPFGVVAARSAFAGLDQAAEDAARTLGLGPVAVFRRVALPAAARPIGAGLLLAWLRGFGEFGATAMVAYHPYSLPVFTYVAFGAGGLPAMLPVLAPTLAAALAVLLLAGLLARAPSDNGATGAEEPAAPPSPTVAPSGQPGRAVGPITPGAGFALAARGRRGRFVLAVDWHTDARRLAVLGASGSGKSLLLRLIAGVAHGPDTRIGFGDTALDLLPPEQRRIGYVPQEYGLPPHLAVDRQLRLAPDHDDALLRALVDRLGLGDLGRRRPRDLSRGQQQRVALARALARRAPRLLLLDEPFSALDAPLRAEACAVLADLQGELAATTTTLLVTHDPAEAQRLADELLLLEHGRVLQVGPTDAVWRRPANERAARLLGARNAARGTVTPDGLAIAVGRGVTVAVGGALPPPGTAIGWSVAPGAARIDSGGDYAAVAVAIGPVVNGERIATVRVGDAIIEAVGSGYEVRTVSIAPEAVQVWPAGAVPDARGKVD